MDAIKIGTLNVSTRSLLHGVHDGHVWLVLLARTILFEVKYDKFKRDI